MRRCRVQVFEQAFPFYQRGRKLGGESFVVRSEARPCFTGLDNAFCGSETAIAHAVGAASFALVPSLPMRFEAACSKRAKVAVRPT